MAAIERFTIRVNGSPHEVSAPPEMPLLWALRQELGMRGTKFGCGAGLCGACMVHFNGAPVPSCQLQVGRIGEGEVTTIEGMQGDELFTRLQEAWSEIDVPQCGYCQAGQLMRAHALLTRQPNANAAAVDGAMRGNICRCATYPRIREAILSVAGGEG